MKNLAKQAFISTIPVLTGYIMLGMGFGVILTTKGYSPIWAFFMALFMYAGSMQYVGVALLASKATFLTVAITTLMVNARHLFYGISIIDKYKGAGKLKPYMMFALTDETYSLVCSTDIEGEHKHKYYFLVSILNQCYWITGCVLGAVLGSTVPFNSTGIDFVLTALFICIFVEQWQSTKNHTSALIGVASAIICLIIFGHNNFLIPTMIMIASLLTFLKKKLEVLTDE